MVGVLFTLDILSQACEKHIQTPFSLWQFQFWSITQAIMLCHVSVHSGTFCCLRHRARDSISVAYFDRVSLRSKRFQSSYSTKVRAWAKKKWKGEREGRRGNYCPQTPQFWKTPLDISRFGSFVNWQLVKIDNEQISRFEKFTLFPKTRSTRLQNCNKKKLYHKRRLKL